MSIPVGTKVRTKFPFARHPAGTETFILAGREDTVEGYKKPVGLIGKGFGEMFEYALDLRGYSQLPLLVVESEVEVIEDAQEYTYSTSLD